MNISYREVFCNSIDTIKTKSRLHNVEGQLKCKAKNESYNRTCITTICDHLVFCVFIVPKYAHVYVVSQCSHLMFCLLAVSPGFWATTAKGAASACMQTWTSLTPMTFWISCVTSRVRVVTSSRSKLATSFTEPAGISTVNETLNLICLAFVVRIYLHVRVYEL